MLTGKKRIQLRSPSNSDACSQGSARPHIGCHEKDCTSRIYGGVTHFVHMHQQSREDSVHQSSHTSDLLRSTLPPKWTPTRHRGEQASRKPPGQKGLNKTQCKNVRWPTSFVTPLISARAPRPRPHIRVGATEHDNPQRPRDQSDNVGKTDRDSTHQIIKHLTTHRLQAKPNLRKHD